ncbi:MAG: hypothetical protein P8N09_01245 [Planctomycetota bacterium]|nr:hypothetical protein [Planctomycetota bacterium]
MPRGLFNLLLTLTLPVVAGAQSAVWSPENSEPWDYLAAPLEPHCLQTYRLFLPDEPFTQPPEGWPVVVSQNLKGYKVSNDTTVIVGGSALGEMLARGLAVVVARATPSQELSDPQWADWCGTAPDLPGHGMFHPPRTIPPDLVAQKIAPYEHPAYHMPEKDAVMLLQHVRHLARSEGPFETDREQAMASLDHRRIAAHGVSSGATSMLWAAAGPDRRDLGPWAGLAGQHAESTRPHLVAFRTPQMWRPLFDPDLQFDVNHFGLNGHSEIDAERFGDATPDELLALSPLAFQDEEWADTLPMYLQYGETSVCVDYLPSDGAFCGPYPFCYDGWGQEGVNNPGGQPSQLHPSWSGYAWKTAHPDSTELVISTAEAYAQADGVEAVPLFEGSAALNAHMANWLAEQMAALVPSVAAPAADILPGGKVLGSLGEDAVHSLAFEATAGTMLRATLKRVQGALQPALRLVASDGSWLNVPGESVLGSKKALLKKVEIPTTGAYRLEVLGQGPAAGDYKLKLRLAQDKVHKAAVVVTDATEEVDVTFEAVAGTTLKRFEVQRTKVPKGSPKELDGVPAKWFPTVVHLRAPDGRLLPVDSLLKTSASGKSVSGGPLLLAQTGTYTLRVGSDQDSVGYGRVRVRLARPKASGPVQVEP